MNIVVVPAYRRPALLALTLKSIERSPQACFQRYLFSIDREAYKSIDSVIETFKCPSSGVVRRRHKYPGYTFNILEALKSACEQLKPMDLIYLIAEDVTVSTDFFAFCEEAHTLDKKAAWVSGTRGPRKIMGNDSDGIVYVSDRLNHLQAVCFKAHAIHGVVAHATREYYRDMIGYCATYGSYGCEVKDAEIDGLIRRVFERSSMRGIYPNVPRAFHTGFIGTNRGGQAAIEFLNPLDWRDDCDRIEAMSVDQINALADVRYRDIEKGDLIRRPVSLRVV